MRLAFEKNISGYNAIAKDLEEGGLTLDEERNLAHELIVKIKRIVKSRHTTVESQKNIFDLQKEKQGIMNELKKRITRLHDPENVSYRQPGESLVVREGEHYVVKGEGSKPDSFITKGEMLTDIEWNMYYYLDPQTVDLKIRKRYLIEDAKRELLELLNAQIEIDEIASSNTTPAMRETYIKKSENTGDKFGFIAERMVRCFLQKLSYDYNLDFVAIEADVDLDIRQKIDFIIRRRNNEKGVRVEERVEEHGTMRTGVQFTTSSTLATLAHKAHQVATANEYLTKRDVVSNIILVSIPAHSVRTMYTAWRNNPKPGGPDKLWDAATKEIIFRKVLEGILSQEEIERDWKIIQAS